MQSGIFPTPLKGQLVGCRASKAMKFKDLIASGDPAVVKVTLTAGACLAVYLNHGGAGFGAGILEVAPDEPSAVIWHFLAAFAVLGLVPALAWMFLIRQPLAALGITVGDLAYGLRFVGLTLPLLVVPIVLIGAQMSDIRTEYPLARGIGVGAADLVFYETMYLLYYAGYELFFRGLLTLGLAPRIGAFPAVSLSMLVSTAIHLGKPGGEVWGAVLVGFVFGWLALRTRSVLWPFILHAFIGVLTDVFVVMGPGSLR